MSDEAEPTIEERVEQTMMDPDSVQSALMYLETLRPLFQPPALPVSEDQQKAIDYAKKSKMTYDELAISENHHTRLCRAISKYLLWQLDVRYRGDHKIAMLNLHQILKQSEKVNIESLEKNIHEHMEKVDCQLCVIPRLRNEEVIRQYENETDIKLI